LPLICAFMQVAVVSKTINSKSLSMETFFLFIFVLFR
jgi:hypothetical protein